MTTALLAPLEHAQRHLWDEIYRAARDAVCAGAPYLVATRRGAVVPVVSLRQLAQVTRPERAWLGLWWREDRTQ